MIWEIRGLAKNDAASRIFKRIKALVRVRRMVQSSFRLRG